MDGQKYSIDFRISFFRGIRNLEVYKGREKVLNKQDINIISIYQSFPKRFMSLMDLFKEKRLKVIWKLYKKYFPDDGTEK